jgi:hypothetical protein
MLNGQDEIILTHFDSIIYLVFNCHPSLQVSIYTCFILTFSISSFVLSFYTFHLVI